MKPFVVAGLAILTSGCFTTRYLFHAAGGQYQLIHEARTLSSAMADPDVPPRVKALLSKVPAIKRFGQHHGLTPTSNYRNYVDLRRSAAVYVVQGCESLAFEPRRWSFPIVGSVPYLGFFEEAKARAYADTLQRDEAIDVTVRTASAYSTLGWFPDPILSTMIDDGPTAFGELANVVLHESVHATVYVPSQSSFNESLASFVADELTWQLVIGRSGYDSAEARAWRSQEARQAQVMAELRRAHADLKQLYESTLSIDEKKAQKAARLKALQTKLGLRRLFNNADLVGVKTYDSGQEAFARLRRACGSWARLFDAVRTLRPTDFEHAQTQHFDDTIDALAARSCPGH